MCDFASVGLALFALAVFFGLKSIALSIKSIKVECSVDVGAGTIHAMHEDASGKIIPRQNG